MNSSGAIKLFGAALDPLDHPERVALKQAFIAAAREGRIPADFPRDPYEALTRALPNPKLSCLSPVGKLDIPEWLTPCPGPEGAAALDPQRFRDFLDEDRCRDLADRCRNFITERIFPGLPGLLAVDHSLAGGAISAVTRRYGPEAVSCLVLDSHFDGLPTRLRHPSGRDPDPTPETYHCGSFLRYLLEEGKLLPQNLILVGVSDYPAAGSRGHDPLADAYLAYADQGVSFFTKSQVRAPEFAQILGRRLDAIRTPWVYVSLDADVGACAGIPAVRFMDRVGLEADEILRIADQIGQRLRAAQFDLAGFDISEIDVHLLGLDQNDPTLEVCVGFLERLCGNGKGMARHAPTLRTGRGG